MAFYVVQEDGTSKILLEDGTSGILLENQGVAVPFISSATAVYTATRSGQRAAPFIASTTALYGPSLHHQAIVAIEESAIFGAPAFGWAYFGSGPHTLDVHISAPHIATATVVYAPALRPGQVFASFIASTTVVYAPHLPSRPSFIASTTVVYAPELHPIHAAFIASTTVVYTPALFAVAVRPSFIASVTVVYAPEISQTVFGELPFIDSVTLVYLPTLMQTFTGGGVSQVTLEVAAAFTDGDGLVSQVTIELVVPQYKELKIWQTS